MHPEIPDSPFSLAANRAADRMARHVARCSAFRLAIAARSAGGRLAALSRR